METGSRSGAGTRGTDVAGPKYYPILKWKAGELAAVKKLALADRSLMLPILELLKVVNGGIYGALAPTLVKSGVAALPVGLDPKLLMPGGVSLSALMKLCHAAQKDGFDAHPVIHAGDLFGQIPQLTQMAGSAHVVLRLRMQLITWAATQAALVALRKAVGRSCQIHVIYDFGSIGEVDPAALSAFVAPFVRDTLAQGIANCVAMSGGSFPMNLAGIPLGVKNFLPRREWKAWALLRSQPGCEDVRFGDYNVTNPDPQEIKNFWEMDPAAAIRYALPDHWWLLRAKAAKKHGFDQYNTLCRLLIADPRYYTKAFCFGDERYHHYAQAGSSSGGYTEWRRDACSHHLVQTVRLLDTLI